MEFIMSFSAGKDSVLALHKMLAQGHTCRGLMVMYNEEAGRSWFHGADSKLLDAISRALALPLLRCPAAGVDYHTAMEACLREAKAQGVEACAFGDIDIEEHRLWDEARCAAVGLTPMLPLWGRDREENVREVLALGYRCLVKCIDPAVLPESVLGKPLDHAVLDALRQRGGDLCGENGEYHTVVVDGPVFCRPVPYTCGDILRFERISAIDIQVKETPER